MTTDQRLDALLAYVHADRRVCSMPPFWSQLWEMLPGKQRVDVGWEPPPPLILGAWWLTSPIEKRQRLVEHIEYAAHHGTLEEVAVFLRTLPADSWLYDNPSSL